MANTESTPDQFDDEIAQVADAYFRARQSGETVTIDELVAQYPHLGGEIRQALEAIDLLLAPGSEPLPEILDDFRLERELGRGGMGIVYLATQSSLDRKVALKVMRMADADAIARFRREARAAAALQHDHIVPIYSVGESPGLQYYAMQYIEGTSVASLIANGHELAPNTRHREKLSRIARWGADVADALHHAHQQGINHRDIKPSNLMIDRQERIWLTDFGLAGGSHASADEGAGSYQGTPNYMSPEQALAIDAPVDHRSDIYSLGITLIEWLTGRSVVGGENAVESLTQLQHNCVEGQRTLLKPYGRDCLAVLEKCTVREPQSRYQSCADLATDLRALAQRRPVAARPQLPLIRHFRNFTSDKSQFQLAGLAVVASVALLMIGVAVSKAYSGLQKYPILLSSASGEVLTVSLRDSAGTKLSQFTGTDAEFLAVPGQELLLDVSALHRLSYQRMIDPNPDAYNIHEYALAEPQSQRWLLPDVVWYLNRGIVRHGKSTEHCIALCSDGLVMLEVSSGKTMWQFRDPAGIRWGNTIRGCPASFQPDRFTVIQDINGNDCEELVLAHPERAELLCLDSHDGKQLWRTDLLQSAGIQTPNADSLCPIVIQEFSKKNGHESALCVVVASRVPKLSGADRWIMSVEPTTGKVMWKLLSQQTINWASIPFNSPLARPLNIQWGEVADRPVTFGEFYFAEYYVDDYWRAHKFGATANPYDTNVRLGTLRPFSLDPQTQENWHWIDGEEWHVVDGSTGRLIRTWKLPSDSLFGPKFLRRDNGKPLVLTAHSTVGREIEIRAWDGEASSPIWTQTLNCNLDQMPQSYLSRQQDFPIVVDFEGDGIDEWMVPTYEPVGMSKPSPNPPYSKLMAHRSSDGQPLWPEPFCVPNGDSMVERGVVVGDRDGDGWKDLLLGSRFQGGAVRPGMACFVDLISGRTGQRIWHRQIRNGASGRMDGATELVELAAMEERQLIAVVTFRVSKSHRLEFASPYATTFLDLESGREQSFGPGIRAHALVRETWLEHRLPPSGSAARAALLGWSYPISKSQTPDQVLWSKENCGVGMWGDLDRDGYPEVLCSENKEGFREDTLLSGLTGSKRWSRRTESSLSRMWWESGCDGDRNGIADLVTMTTCYDDPSRAKANATASIEVISGSTGKTIWKHLAAESGMVSLVGFIDRKPDKAPLLIYQHMQSRRVTCVDLDSRHIAWSSDAYQAEVVAQEFTPWIYEAKNIWFFVGAADNSSDAYFVDATSGELLLKIPLGQKTADPTTQAEKAIRPVWIHSQGRDLLAIQTLQQRQLNASHSTWEYQTNLWLVDRSVKLAAHWSETTQTSSSPAVASWFKEADMYAPSPAVVKSLDNQELIAVSSSFDGSVGFRLLALDGEDVTLERTVSVPIAPTSRVLFVQTLDCDRDGFADFLSMSESGLDCCSGTGKLLWHKPTLPEGSFLLMPQSLDDRTYLCYQAQPGDLQSLRYLDASTGEDCTDSVDDQRQPSLNRDVPQHLSSLVLDTSDTRSNLVAFRRGDASPRSSWRGRDPRYVRLFPWVVDAKFFLWSAGSAVKPVGWPRIFKLTLGVFLIPAAAAWYCFRRRFSVRQLLLVATACAIATSLVLSEQRNFPAGHSRSYTMALPLSLSTAICICLFAWPLLEFMQTAQRRRLALTVYVAFLAIIPVFTLTMNPVGAIRTTYTFQESWYLLWWALLPTGAMLLVIYGLWWLSRRVLVAMGRNK